MSRYYQVIVAKPLNLNPAGTVMRFMPGETHRLEEYLGEMIFAENSPYGDYFRLVEIVPPYPAKEEPQGESVQDVLKASDVGVLGVFPPNMDEVKPEKVEEVKNEAVIDLNLKLDAGDVKFVEPPLVKTESTKKPVSKADK